ncbi:MAG: hypothetical protein WCL50_04000 [Spirochaetota bacterium]
MLVQLRAAYPFDIIIALRPSDQGGSMLDFFHLEKQLQGMLVGTSAVFPPGVGKCGLYLCAMLLKEGPDEVVEGLVCGDGELVREQPPPCVAGMAFEQGLDTVSRPSRGRKRRTDCAYGERVPLVAGRILGLERHRRGNPFGFPGIDHLDEDRSFPGGGDDILPITTIKPGYSRPTIRP